MNVVSFREFESIRVLPTLTTPDERAVSIAELEILDSLSSSLGIQVVEHLSRTQIRSKQYVGAIQMPTRMVEFLPKIETTGVENLPVVRHNLLEMLLVAYDLSGQTSGQAGMASRNVGWLDLLIQLFLHALADQVRRGLVKRYRTEQVDLPTVKGRILMEEQLRRNQVHKERSACEFDEFDENHALNQLFKLVVQKMLRSSANVSIQQAVRELLPVFESVDSVHPTRAWLDTIKLDRMSERYGFCMSLAKLFIQGMTTDIYSGAQRSFALMFDMNMLFERYIGKQMKKALRSDGCEVFLQHSKHYLIRDSKSSKQLFQLRPDIVVVESGNPVCIVDTKWKRLKPAERKVGVLQEDLYQMLAYSERYKCDSVLLLYPWNQSVGDFLGVHKQFIFESKTSRVIIGEVSLQDLKSVPEQLVKLMDECRI